MVRKLGEQFSRLVRIVEGERNDERVYLSEELKSEGESVAMGNERFYYSLYHGANIGRAVGQVRRIDTCGDHALLCGIDDSEG